MRIAVRRLARAQVVAAAVATLAMAQLPSESRLDAARASIVRVDTRECAGGSAVATGFIWGDRSQVVTTLHAVAGCANVSVFYEGRRASRRASIKRVLRRADLALLEVTDPFDMPPLDIAAAPLQLHQQALALGYHLNVSAMAGTTLTLRYGGKTLREIVPPAVEAELERSGSPAVDLNIINFEGHLLPGLSGAPILDGDGRVAAIADGGLETGAASSSWGLPVHYLTQLAASRDAVPASVARLRTLFAADIDTTPGERVRCGDGELVKVRRRSLPDLARSADDQLGLLQLSAVLGFQQAEFEFDIYQHLSSGATVVVPAGMTLSPGGALCVGRLASGRMEMKIRLTNAGSSYEAQQESVQYENDIALAEGGAWQVDPSWSYLAPISRFDGLTVRRKAAIRYGPGQFGWGSQKYLFETLALRGNVLIGSSVTNHDLTPQTVQAEMACVAGASTPVCQNLFVSRREWAQMVLAVQMTTFPIG